MGKVIKGNPVSSGIEMGKAFLFHSPKNYFLKEHIDQNQVKMEEDRFQNAVRKSKSQLKKISSDLEKKLGKEAALIIEAQYMLLDDRSLIDSIGQVIRQELVKTEWAIKEIEKKYVQLFSSIPDLAFQEKRNDISDILNRIITNLKSSRNQLGTEEESLILIANDIPPSIIATLISQKKILGLVLNNGCDTSHSIILAKTLEVPTIIGTINSTELIQNGDRIIIDSIKGEVIINPDKQQLNQYEIKKKELERFNTEKKEILKLPHKTADAIPFQISANIEFPFESDQIQSHGAKGIGLFRTEFLFTYPEIALSEEQQFLTYKKISQQVYPDQLTIRTFDVGRDKTTHYIDHKSEANPALGTMAIRLFLKEPKLLKTQIRAILRANENGNIKLLFPMVTEIEEIIALRKMIEVEKADLKAGGILPDRKLEIGIMIEIPGIVKVIRHLKDLVDFFSLGTNDLVQYLLAVDRGNSAIAYLNNPFNPAIIQTLTEILVEVQKVGKMVTVCGEIASKGLTSLLLLGIGYRHFSMNPTSILEIKKLFSTVEVEFLKKQVEQIRNLKLKSEIKKTFLNNITTQYPGIFKYTVTV